MDEGTLLWTPSQEMVEGARLTRYMRGLGFDDYDALWRWSVEDLSGFWESIWRFFDVSASAPYSHVLDRPDMPGAHWFEGSRLNFAEHLLRQPALDRPAIVFKGEGQTPTELSWTELEAQAGAFAAWLRGQGVRPSDRVCAYMPNIPHTVIAFLATASLGAVWACCAPEMGVRSAVERFRQLEPVVLIAADGYRFGGQAIVRAADVGELQASLPSLRATVRIPYLEAQGDWPEIVSKPAQLTFEQVPFEHPLWVLYTSGTTGWSKAVVHGHGGVLLEQFKFLGLHQDLRADDRVFWHTSSGWMLWNQMVASFLFGSTIVVYDGSPAYPNVDALWAVMAETGVTAQGTGAPYLLRCMRAGVHPGREHDLSRVRRISAGGSRLPPEACQWVYDSVKPDVWLGPASGGTDACAAFVGSCPILPVWAGEMQCRCLGVKAEVFDAAGRAVIDEPGELVISRPTPSMPLYFWGDHDGSRYRDSYFNTYPGVWRHGDWARITSRGSAVIYGRADSAIESRGVRIGTSELYDVVESVPGVGEAVAVEVGDPARLLLFVVPAAGVDWSSELAERVRASVEGALGRAYVPDEIRSAPAVPRTLNGKKVELPVKRILEGARPDDVVSRGSLANPGSVDFFALVQA